MGRTIAVVESDRIEWGFPTEIELRGVKYSDLSNVLAESSSFLVSSIFFLSSSVTLAILIF